MSLLSELLDEVPHRNKSQLLQTRAKHALSAAQHFIKLLKETYPQDEADNLIKRFLLASKNNEPNKLLRHLK